MTSETRASVTDCVQLEANVDDLDPRLWPHVIDRLLAAGAHDAWVTPILMKKGRPAHTVAALCDEPLAVAVRTVMFRETSTLGVCESVVRKYALARDERTIEVAGHSIRVKTGYLDGEVVNRSVEWDDVVAAAEASGLSAKQVLSLATAAAAAIEGDVGAGS